MSNKPRKDPRRVDLAVRGLIVLALIAALLELAYLRTSGSLGGDPVVSAQLRNAGGSLRKGSDVKISGVLVGKVRGISRGDNGGVRVDLAMFDADLADVPSNVEARILPATVFGTSFVDLVVYGRPAKTALEKGAEIPADQTQDTLELQQALDDIDRLVKALGPAELQSAISSAATALDGRGDEIGHIVDVADRYLSRLTPRLPLARADLRKLADNLELVDDVAPDLLDATRDGLVTLRTIVTQRASITAIITGGTTLARTADSFVSSNVARLKHVVDNGALLLDTLYENRRVAITAGLATNIRVGQKLPTAIKEGFLRSDAVFRFDAPPYYTAADRPRYGSAPRSQRPSPATFRGLVGGGR